MDLRIAVKRGRRILRRYRKLFKLLFIVAAAVCAVFYFLAFFSGGVTFQGETFLKKGGSKSTVTYTGKDAFGDIVLTVHQRSKTETDISYLVPYNKLKTYTVTITEVANKNPDLPPSYKMTITAGSGSILFDGEYKRGDPFLYSKAGLPIHSGDDSVREGVNPYLSYEPNLRRMAGFVTGEYFQRRGSWGMLLLGAALIALVWIDVKNPIISYKVRETLIGSAPEPTDLSEAIQFAVRAIVVIVGVGFLLAAI